MNYLRNYLLRRHSKIDLWDAVCNARQTLQWTEFPRLECSDNDRYTVTMLLSQFLSFPTATQEKILITVGFTWDEYMNILKNHSSLLTDKGLDIIFGWEPTKGKIYLNCSDGYMVSYRTDKTRKIYVPSGANTLIVYEHHGPTGIHKRNGTKWTAYDLDGKIVHQYWRPLPEWLLFLFDILN